MENYKKKKQQIDRQRDSANPSNNNSPFATAKVSKETSKAELQGFRYKSQRG